VKARYPLATMSADRVISVIPFEMASEYVKRMMATGAESELFYHEAYHAYWDWGNQLEQDGFTERVFKEARQKKLDEECEEKVSTRWWATARGYWLFSATNGNKHLDISIPSLSETWDAFTDEEREKWIAEAEEWGPHLNDRLKELREQDDEAYEENEDQDVVRRCAEVAKVVLVTANSI
jgi:hypothetical protein